MKTKKWTAVLCAIALILSAVQTTAFAASGDVAEMGGQQFQTLQEAVNAVTDGTETTIKLLDNIVMPKNMVVEIPAGKKIILDMAGKKITVEQDYTGRPIVNNGTLTVTGNGAIDSSNSNTGYGAINNTGTLVIKNGEYLGHTYGNGSAIRNTGAGAMLTVEDGTFEATCAIYNEGTAVLQGGTYSGTTCSQCNSKVWSYTIRNGEATSHMTINGGIYTGVQGAVSASIGYLEVNGGTFKSVKCGKVPTHTATFYALYAAGEEGKVKCVVNDGHFETEGKATAVLIGNDNTSGDGGINAQATGIINGGTFVAPAGVPALIGAPNTGDPQISGGSFTSSVAKWTASDIKYELNDSGTYTYHKTLAEALKNAGSGATVAPTATGSIAPSTTTVELKYDTGGGTNTLSLVADDTGKVTLPSLTRQGYALKGWQRGGDVYGAGESVLVQDGESFTAIWMIPVSGVSLNKTELNLRINEEAALTAAVTPDNAENKDVRWSSDNPAVAKVDSSGKVTALSAGSAVITVTTVDGEKSASCQVTVSQETAAGKGTKPESTENKADIPKTGDTASIALWIALLALAAAGIAGTVLYRIKKNNRR